MELIQNAFEQGLIPGIVIVIYLIINKIIDNNKRNPLDDIAKLLNIVTRDIIEKDREKSKAVISITMVNAASECAKFVASTIITNNVDNNRDQIEYNARHLVNSVYYDAYSKLNMYRGDEDYLSHYMKEEWKEDASMAEKQVRIAELGFPLNEKNWCKLTQGQILIQALEALELLSDEQQKSIINSYNNLMLE